MDFLQQQGIQVKVIPGKISYYVYTLSSKFYAFLSLLVYDSTEIKP